MVTNLNAAENKCGNKTSWSFDYMQYYFLHVLEDFEGKVDNMVCVISTYRDSGSGTDW